MNANAMKTAHRLFAAACVSIAALAGCASKAGPSTDTTGVEAAPETTVVRHTAQEIEALPPGERLRLDLSVPNTVHAVTYTDPAILDRVLVVRGDEQYVLSTRAPATATADDHTERQLVITGDQVVDTGGGQSLAPSEDSARIGAGHGATPDALQACKCPCCIQVAGHLVCCD